MIKDILTDIVELIQRLAYKLDEAGIYYDAKNLYDKILEELND